MTSSVNLAPNFSSKQIPVFIWKNLSSRQKAEKLQRPASVSISDLVGKVQIIVDAVKSEGDQALRKFTRDFDKLICKDFLVEEEDLEKAVSSLEKADLLAMKTAIENTRKFHSLKLPKSLDCETSPGVFCSLRPRPYIRAGIYVPGGKAPLPSSVWMQSVPAALAGVKELILCTPPARNGKVPPEILAAARLTGVKKVFCAGGAQAVAAMAFGTASIPKVDIITGPGNQWVTTAKKIVSRSPFGPATDMEAGPSEVLIIADAFANPAFIAADLLAQAEHGPDSLAIVLSADQGVAGKVGEELIRQMNALSRREILQENFNNLRLIVVENAEEAREISEAFAPEHLIIQTLNPDLIAENISNAGSVFLGMWSPETVGDYASGTNHVLPTGGWARKQNGLSVESFLRYVTFQRLTPQGLKVLGPDCERLAAMEGLDAHKNAVSLRLQTLRGMA